MGVLCSGLTRGAIGEYAKWLRAEIIHRNTKAPTDDVQIEQIACWMIVCDWGYTFGAGYVLCINWLAMSRESYHSWLWSLLLCLCDVTSLLLHLCPVWHLCCVCVTSLLLCLCDIFVVVSVWVLCCCVCVMSLLLCLCDICVVVSCVKSLLLCLCEIFLVLINFLICQSN